MTSISYSANGVVYSVTYAKSKDGLLELPRSVQSLELDAVVSWAIENAGIDNADSFSDAGVSLPSSKFVHEGRLRVLLTGNVALSQDALLKLVAHPRLSVHFIFGQTVFDGYQEYEAYPVPDGCTPMIKSGRMFYGAKSPAPLSASDAIKVVAKVISLAGDAPFLFFHKNVALPRLPQTGPMVPTIKVHPDSLTVGMLTHTNCALDMQGAGWKAKHTIAALYADFKGSLFSSRARGSSTDDYYIATSTAISGVSCVIDGVKIVSDPTAPSASAWKVLKQVVELPVPKKEKTGDLRTYEVYLYQGCYILDDGVPTGEPFDFEGKFYKVDYKRSIVRLNLSDGNDRDFWLSYVAGLCHLRTRVFNYKFMNPVRDDLESYLLTQFLHPKLGFTVQAVVEGRSIPIPDDFAEAVHPFPIMQDLHVENAIARAIAGYCGPEFIYNDKGRDYYTLGSARQYLLSDGGLRATRYNGNPIHVLSWDERGLSVMYNGVEYGDFRQSGAQGIPSVSSSSSSSSSGSISSVGDDFVYKGVSISKVGDLRKHFQDDDLAVGVYEFLSAKNIKPGKNTIRLFKQGAALVANVECKLGVIEEGEEFTIESSSASSDDSVARAAVPFGVEESIPSSPDCSVADVADESGDVEDISDKGLGDDEHGLFVSQDDDAFRWNGKVYTNAKSIAALSPPDNATAIFSYFNFLGIVPGKKWRKLYDQGESICGGESQVETPSADVALPVNADPFFVDESDLDSYLENSVVSVRPTGYGSGYVNGAGCNQYVKESASVVVDGGVITAKVAQEHFNLDWATQVDVQERMIQSAEIEVSVPLPKRVSKRRNEVPVQECSESKRQICCVYLSDNDSKDVSVEAASGEIGKQICFKQVENPLISSEDVGVDKKGAVTEDTPECTGSPDSVSNSDLEVLASNEACLVGQDFSEDFPEPPPPLDGAIQQDVIDDSSDNDSKDVSVEAASGEIGKQICVKQVENPLISSEDVGGDKKGAVTEDTPECTGSPDSVSNSDLEVLTSNEACLVGQDFSEDFPDGAINPDQAVALVGGQQDVIDDSIESIGVVVGPEGPSILASADVLGSIPTSDTVDSDFLGVIPENDLAEDIEPSGGGFIDESYSEMPELVTPQDLSVYRIDLQADYYQQLCYGEAFYHHFHREAEDEFDCSASLYSFDDDDEEGELRRTVSFDDFIDYEHCYDDAPLCVVKMLKNAPVGNCLRFTVEDANKELSVRGLPFDIFNYSYLTVTDGNGGLAFNNYDYASDFLASVSSGPQFMSVANAAVDICGTKCVYSKNSSVAGDCYRDYCRSVITPFSTEDLYMLLGTAAEKVDYIPTGNIFDLKVKSRLVKDIQVVCNFLGRKAITVDMSDFAFTGNLEADVCSLVIIEFLQSKLLVESMFSFDCAFVKRNVDELVSAYQSFNAMSPYYCAEILFAFQSVVDGKLQLSRTFLEAMLDTFCRYKVAEDTSNTIVEPEPPAPAINPLRRAAYIEGLVYFPKACQHDSFFIPKNCDAAYCTSKLASVPAAPIGVESPKARVLDEDRVRGITFMRSLHAMIDEQLHPRVASWLKITFDDDASSRCKPDCFLPIFVGVIKYVNDYGVEPLLAISNRLPALPISILYQLLQMVKLDDGVVPVLDWYHGHYVYNDGGLIFDRWGFYVNLSTIHISFPDRFLFVSRIAFAKLFPYCEGFPTMYYSVVQAYGYTCEIDHTVLVNWVDHVMPKVSHDFQCVRAVGNNYQFISTDDERLQNLIANRLGDVVIVPLVNWSFGEFAVAKSIKGSICVPEHTLLTRWPAARTYDYKAPDYREYLILCPVKNLMHMTVSDYLDMFQTKKLKQSVTDDDVVDALAGISPSPDASVHSNLQLIDPMSSFNVDEEWSDTDIDLFDPCDSLESQGDSYSDVVSDGPDYLNRALQNSPVDTYSVSQDLSVENSEGVNGSSEGIDSNAEGIVSQDSAQEPDCLTGVIVEEPERDTQESLQNPEGDRFFDVPVITCDHRGSCSCKDHTVRVKAGDLSGDDLGTFFLRSSYENDSFDPVTSLVSGIEYVHIPKVHNAVVTNVKPTGFIYYSLDRLYRKWRGLNDDTPSPVTHFVRSTNASRVKVQRGFSAAKRKVRSYFEPVVDTSTPSAPVTRCMQRDPKLLQRLRSVLASFSRFSIENSELVNKTFLSIILPLFFFFYSAYVYYNTEGVRSTVGGYEMGFVDDYTLNSLFIHLSREHLIYNLIGCISLSFIAFMTDLNSVEALLSYCLGLVSSYFTYGISSMLIPGIFAGKSKISRVLNISGVICYSFQGSYIHALQCLLTMFIPPLAKSLNIRHVYPLFFFLIMTFDYVRAKFLSAVIIYLHSSVIVGYSVGVLTLVSVTIAAFYYCVACTVFHGGSCDHPTWTVSSFFASYKPEFMIYIMEDHFDINTTDARGANIVKRQNSPDYKYSEEYVLVRKGYLEKFMKDAEKANVTLGCHVPLPYNNVVYTDSGAYIDRVPEGCGKLLTNKPGVAEVNHAPADPIVLGDDPVKQLSAYVKSTNSNIVHLKYDRNERNYSIAKLVIYTKCRFMLYHEAGKISSFSVLFGDMFYVIAAIFIAWIRITHIMTILGCVGFSIFVFSIPLLDRFATHLLKTCTIPSDSDIGNAVVTAALFILSRFIEPYVPSSFMTMYGAYMVYEHESGLLVYNVINVVSQYNFVVGLAFALALMVRKQPHIDVVYLFVALCPVPQAMILYLFIKYTNRDLRKILLVVLSMFTYGGQITNYFLLATLSLSTLYAYYLGKRTYGVVLTIKSIFLAFYVWYDHSPIDRFILTNLTYAPNWVHFVGYASASIVILLVYSKSARRVVFSGMIVQKIWLLCSFLLVCVTSAQSMGLASVGALAGVTQCPAENVEDNSGGKDVFLHFKKLRNKNRNRYRYFSMITSICSIILIVVLFFARDISYRYTFPENDAADKVQDFVDDLLTSYDELSSTDSFNAPKIGYPATIVPTNPLSSFNISMGSFFMASALPAGVASSKYATSITASNYDYKEAIELHGGEEYVRYTAAGVDCVYHIVNTRGVYWTSDFQCSVDPSVVIPKRQKFSAGSIHSDYPWVCKNNLYTDGHMLAKMLGGYTHYYNCMPQKQTTNLAQVDIEDYARGILNDGHHLEYSARILPYVGKYIVIGTKEKSDRCIYPGMRFEPFDGDFVKLQSVTEPTFYITTQDFIDANIIEVTKYNLDCEAAVEIKANGKSWSYTPAVSTGYIPLPNLPYYSVPSTSSNFGYAVCNAGVRTFVDTVLKANNLIDVIESEYRADFVDMVCKMFTAGMNGEAVTVIVDLQKHMYTKVMRQVADVFMGHFNLNYIRFANNAIDGTKAIYHSFVKKDCKCAPYQRTFTFNYRLDSGVFCSDPQSVHYAHYLANTHGKCVLVDNDECSYTSSDIVITKSNNCTAAPKSYYVSKDYVRSGLYAGPPVVTQSTYDSGYSYELVTPVLGTHSDYDEFCTKEDVLPVRFFDDKNDLLMSCGRNYLHVNPTVYNNAKLWDTPFVVPNFRVNPVFKDVNSTRACMYHPVFAYLDSYPLYAKTAEDVCLQNWVDAHCGGVWPDIYPRTATSIDLVGVCQALDKDIVGMVRSDLPTSDNIIIAPVVHHDTIEDAFVSGIVDGHLSTAVHESIFLNPYYNYFLGASVSLGGNKIEELKNYYRDFGVKLLIQGNVHELHTESQYVYNSMRRDFSSSRWSWLGWGPSYKPVLNGGDRSFEYVKASNCDVLAAVTGFDAKLCLEPRYLYGPAFKFVKTVAGYYGVYHKYLPVPFLATRVSFDAPALTGYGLVDYNIQNGIKQRVFTVYGEVSVNQLSAYELPTVRVCSYGDDNSYVCEVVNNPGHDIYGVAIEHEAFNSTDVVLVATYQGIKYTYVFANRGYLYYRVILWLSVLATKLNYIFSMFVEIFNMNFATASGITSVMTCLLYFSYKYCPLLLTILTYVDFPGYLGIIFSVPLHVKFLYHFWVGLMAFWQFNYAVFTVDSMGFFRRIHALILLASYLVNDDLSLRYITIAMFICGLCSSLHYFISYKIWHKRRFYSKDDVASLFRTYVKPYTEGVDDKLITNHISKLMVNDPARRAEFHFLKCVINSYLSGYELDFMPLEYPPNVFSVIFLTVADTITGLLRYFFRVSVIANNKYADFSDVLKTESKTINDMPIPTPSWAHLVGDKISKETWCNKRCSIHTVTSKGVLSCLHGWVADKSYIVDALSKVPTASLFGDAVLDSAEYSEIGFKQLTRGVHTAYFKKNGIGWYQGLITSEGVHNFDTGEGDSGTPIFVLDNGRPVICAMHVVGNVDGYNAAVLYTHAGFVSNVWSNEFGSGRVDKSYVVPFDKHEACRVLLSKFGSENLHRSETIPPKLWASVGCFPGDELGITLPIRDRIAHVLITKNREAVTTVLKTVNTNVADWDGSFRPLSSFATPGVYAYGLDMIFTGDLPALLTLSESSLFSKFLLLSSWFSWRLLGRVATALGLVAIFDVFLEDALLTAVIPSLLGGPVSFAYMILGIVLRYRYFRVYSFFTLYMPILIVICYLVYVYLVTCWRYGFGTKAKFWAGFDVIYVMTLWACTLYILSDRTFVYEVLGVALVIIVFSVKTVAAVTKTEAYETSIPLAAHIRSCAKLLKGVTTIGKTSEFDDSLNNMLTVSDLTNPDTLVSMSDEILDLYTSIKSRIGAESVETSDLTTSVLAMMLERHENPGDILRKYFDNMEIPEALNAMKKVLETPVGDRTKEQVRIYNINKGALTHLMATLKRSYNSDQQRQIQADAQKNKMIRALLNQQNTNHSNSVKHAQVIQATVKLLSLLPELHQLTGVDHKLEYEQFRKDLDDMKSRLLTDGLDSGAYVNASTLHYDDKFVVTDGKFKDYIIQYHVFNGIKCKPSNNMTGMVYLLRKLPPVFRCSCGATVIILNDFSVLEEHKGHDLYKPPCGYTSKSHYDFINHSQTCTSCTVCQQCYQNVSNCCMDHERKPECGLASPHSEAYANSWVSSPIREVVHVTGDGVRHLVRRSEVIASTAPYGDFISGTCTVNGETKCYYYNPSSSIAEPSKLFQQVAEARVSLLKRGDSYFFGDILAASPKPNAQCTIPYEVSGKTMYINGTIRPYNLDPRAYSDETQVVSPTIVRSAQGTKILVDEDIVVNIDARDTIAVLDKYDGYHVIGLDDSRLLYMPYNRTNPLAKAMCFYPKPGVLEAESSVQENSFLILPPV